MKPDLFFNIKGSTDSELMFYLALSFGLEKHPLIALEKMAGFIELTAKKKGIENPLQMTLGLSDGNILYGVRYSSEKKSRSLYCSDDMASIIKVIPELKEDFSLDSRAIVSEPLGDNVHKQWIEVPESSSLRIEDGNVTLLDLRSYVHNGRTQRLLSSSFAN